MGVPTHIQTPHKHLPHFETTPKPDTGEINPRCQSHMSGSNAVASPLKTRQNRSPDTVGVSRIHAAQSKTD